MVRVRLALIEHREKLTHEGESVGQRQSVSQVRLGQVRIG